MKAIAVLRGVAGSGTYVSRKSCQLVVPFHLQPDNRADSIPVAPCPGQLYGQPALLLADVIAQQGWRNRTVELPVPWGIANDHIQITIIIEVSQPKPPAVFYVIGI